ncbi:13973_t:CDS:2, partial [Racocetra fulgida]
PLPDPDVVKPKNQKTNRVKRKDVSVSYVPTSTSFISNDDTSGVPLRKRVVHLIAATEVDNDLLNIDQIVKKVKDSKENVQKVLNEGTWKLTDEAWLTLEPYTWFSYGQRMVSGVVQKMNEVADRLGLPQESPQRPRQPKHNHSSNIDGESRKRIKIASGLYSEIQQNNDIPLSGPFRGTKSTRGKVPKKQAAKTLSNLQKHEDDIEHDSKNILSSRSAKPNRNRSKKTTTISNSSITAEPVTNHANQTTAKGRRGRPAGSKTARVKASSKSTIAASNVAPSKQETIESNGLPSINGVNNNETKQSQYRVNTLSEFRELIDEFKAKQDEYNELDEKLQSWLSLYNELDLNLRSARQSREKPIINRIMEKFGSGSEIFALVEQFNAIEEELCQISTEAWRAAKEGILDE